MNQKEIDRARGHFLVIENELGSMLFDVRSAIQLMPFLEWYQVALINSYVYDGFCKVREQLLTLDVNQYEEGDKNNIE
jgi:hypothetical protein